MGWRHRGIELKSRRQVQQMRPAGLLVAETLELLRGTVAPGMTTRDLDVVAERHIRGQGGVPSFQGYHGFPASICTSVDEVVVHGIPGDREIVEGDVVSIDCGAVVDGWHGDAAITVTVGEVPAEVAALVRVTEQALWRGIAAAAPGGRVGDVSAAVEGHVRAAGSYGIVEDYTGHGIGTAMHQPPDVPNVGRAGRGPRITEGLVLAIEPMVTLGTAETVVLPDDWTVVTTDGSWAAHAEHTVTFTEDGPWVLTALDGGAAALADLGLPCGAR